MPPIQSGARRDEHLSKLDVLAAPPDIGSHRRNPDGAQHSALLRRIFLGDDRIRAKGQRRPGHDAKSTAERQSARHLAGRGAASHRQPSARHDVSASNGVAIHGGLIEPWKPVGSKDVLGCHSAHALA